MNLLTRFFIMSPILFMAVLKLPAEVTDLAPELSVIPTMFKTIVPFIKEMAPGNQLPAADILGFVAYAELASVFFVTIGIAPQLFNLLAALHYFVPVFLLAGADFKFAHLANINQLHSFVVALHVALGFLLLLDAFAPNAKGLKRVAVMQPFLFVATIKFSPLLLSAFMTQMEAIAPSLRAIPADMVPLVGYAEFATILFVVSGACPSLFNLLAAVQYLTPIILTGEHIPTSKPYFWFVLLLHAGCAMFLLDDAFLSGGAAPKKDLSAAKEKRAANKKKHQ
jgi:hypothetical protein